MLIPTQEMRLLETGKSRVKHRCVVCRAILHYIVESRKKNKLLWEYIYAKKTGSQVGKKFYISKIADPEVRRVVR